MRLRGPGAIVLALLLVPFAGAGTPDAPEVKDREGDVRASNADILAAWLESERKGLRFSIRTLDGSLPAQFPDVIYWISFTIEETDLEMAAVVGFGNDGVLRGHLARGERTGGLDDPGSPFMTGVPYERAANGGVVGLQEERGRPSTWSGVIPWDAYPGFGPGATLTGIVVGSTFYDRSGGTYTGAADTARTSRPYEIPPPSGLFTSVVGFFPIYVPAWVIPTIVIGCTALGMLAGLAIAIRRRRTAPVAAPVAVPVAAPRPPGERFRRAPPPR